MNGDKKGRSQTDRPFVRSVHSIFGSRIQGLGSRVPGLVSRVSGLESRVPGPVLGHSTVTDFARFLG